MSKRKPQMPTPEPEYEDDGESLAGLDRFINSFIYYLPMDKFIYKEHGRWQMTSPLGREGIINYLASIGLPGPAGEEFIKRRGYRVVSGIRIEPGDVREIIEDGAHKYINTWVKPELQPAPGEFPVFDVVLDKLTGGDKEGRRWLEHWLAYKIQNPAAIPKVAVVFSTKPAAGKGFLAGFMRAALGMENTATIDRGALESKFNYRWIDKLFVFADEVMTNDNVKDISDRLKIYIDGGEVEREGKNINQTAIRSRMAWMFASNSTTSPVSLEKGDRRFTVFSMHEDVPTSHKQYLDSHFESDRVTPTANYIAQMRGFLHHLHQVDVDVGFIRRPYENDARANLIKASAPMDEAFLEEVRASGVDPFIDSLVEHGDYSLGKKREEWDFGEKGVSFKIIYDIYTKYCKEAGGRALRKGKFRSTLINQGIARYNPMVRTLGHQVECYVLPRAPAVPKDDAPPAKEPETFPIPKGDA